MLSLSLHQKKSLDTSEALSLRISQLGIIDALFVNVMFNDENIRSNTSLKKIRSAIKETRENE